MIYIQGYYPHLDKPSVSKVERKGCVPPVNRDYSQDKTDWTEAFKKALVGTTKNQDKQDGVILESPAAIYEHRPTILLNSGLYARPKLHQSPFVK